MLTGYIITAQGQNVNRILKNFLFFSKKYFFFLKSSKKWLKSGAFERKKGICWECGDGDGSKKTKKIKRPTCIKLPMVARIGIETEKGTQKEAWKTIKSKKRSDASFISPLSASCV